MNTRSIFYKEGHLAFFDGFNSTDVTKFYPADSFEAREWLQGMGDARDTAAITSVPLYLLKSLDDKIREELEKLNQEWDKAKATGDEAELALIERKMAAIISLIAALDSGGKDE